jgi:hypothetical protein
VDEETRAKLKFKNDESKKAQAAKKVADRKAKKPPSDPPPVPEKPEAHPVVAELHGALRAAMAAARAKLLECKCALKLLEVREPSLLTDLVLLDVGSRTREEDHPNIATLAEALKEATDAKCEDALLGATREVLDDAIARRHAQRTRSALVDLLRACHVELPTDEATGGAAGSTAESTDERRTWSSSRV